MPKNVEGSTLDLDKIPEDECKQITLNCPWKTKVIIVSKGESLTAIINRLKLTFNYDFCVRVTAHPEGAPNISKQID